MREITFFFFSRIDEVSFIVWQLGKLMGKEEAMMGCIGTRNNLWMTV